ESPIETAATALTDTERAVETLLDQLDAEHADLTFVFFSPEHDEEVVRDHLDRRTRARGVAGTTAGEVSDRGFSRGTMSGMSLHGDDVRAAVDVVPNLDELSLVPLSKFPKRLAGQIGRDPDDLSPDRHVWILLLDGLSGSEELLTPFFMQSAPETGLVGGSLADDLQHEGTSLVHHGRTYSDAAALVLLEYDRPFALFSGNHMEFTEETVEVTGVTDGGRRLTKLDGDDAVDRYAELLDLDPSEIDADVTVRHPFGFPFRGRPYVCSIRQIHDSGSFSMANTVHRGDELHLLETQDLVEDTDRAITSAREELGPATDARGMLAFHCVGRFLEAKVRENCDELADVLTQIPVSGLNTYGEQFGAVHTNHSLTGVIFG
ncbi:MAG: FIST signal transduction protein, partial [Bradymonadaceae bacterium]